MDFSAYKFLGRGPEIEAARRASLDYYANLAQLSQLLLILVLPVTKFALSTVLNLLQTSAGLDRTAMPSTRKSDQQAHTPGRSRAAQPSDAFLSSEVIKGYGTYEQWIFGFGWATWLWFLATHDTRPDYMLLVKRFGIVGASQLPIHYLLAMKHPYAPLRLLSVGSRRQLLYLHFVTGRITIPFIALHAFLYCRVFMQMNMFWANIQLPKIAVGLTSIAVFATVGLTSFGTFRRRAHSWFYMIHLVGSAVIPVLLYFHVSHIRIYVLECGAIVMLNALLRLTSNWNSGISINSVIY